MARGVSKKNTVIGIMGCRVLARFFNPGGTNRGLTGERNTHSIMTNVIYDFTVGWPVTPHIGFGIGAVDNVDSISLNTVTLNGLGLTTVSGPGGVLGRIGAGTPFPNPTLGGTFLKGSQWNFGYQAIAGFRYDINPLLAFDVDYRYLATTSPTYHQQRGSAVPAVRLPAGHCEIHVRIQHAEHRRQLDDEVRCAAAGTPAAGASGPAAAADPSGVSGVLRLG